MIPSINLAEFFPALHFSAIALAHFAFSLISAFVAGISVVFFYHWKKYSQGGVLMAVAEASYITVSVLLLAAAFFSIN